MNRFLDRVYSPDRVLHPLRRVGAKGEGRFEQITWDEALAEIADALPRHRRRARRRGDHALRQRRQPEPAGADVRRALLAPPRRARVSPARCAARSPAPARPPPTAPARASTPATCVHSKLIILWGTNTRLTNRHLWPFIEAARAKGAQVVVIDPLRTITADSADWFLQPLPGTDVALMLAMMHVLIRDGLVDHEWVARAHRRLRRPRRARRRVDARARAREVVRPRRRRHRDAGHAVRHHPPGRDPHARRRRAPRARGDVLPHAHLPARARRRVARPGRRLRAQRRRVERTTCSTTPRSPAPTCWPAATPRGVPMAQLGRALTDTDDAPPLKAVVMIGVNAMVSVPNTELVRQGLLRDDLFTVVHDQFLTDTARYADIVLPATTQIEAVDVVTVVGPPLPRLERSRRSSRSARRSATASCTAGWRRRWASPSRRCSTTTSPRCAPRCPPSTSTQLRADGFVRGAVPRRRPPVRRRRVPHRVGQGRAALRRAGRARASRRCPPTRARPRRARRRFPFALLTPKQHTRFLNSSYSHLPKHGPLEGSPFVELHADDAAALGLAEGDCAARVERPRRASSCRCASANACGPAWSPSRGAGGPQHHARQRARWPTRSPTTRSPTGVAASPTATPRSPSHRLSDHTERVTSATRHRR